MQTGERTELFLRILLFPDLAFIHSIPSFAALLKCRIKIRFQVHREIRLQKPPIGIRHTFRVEKGKMIRDAENLVGSIFFNKAILICTSWIDTRSSFYCRTPVNHSWKTVHPWGRTINILFRSFPWQWPLSRHHPPFSLTKATAYKMRWVPYNSSELRTVLVLSMLSKDFVSFSSL